MKIHTRILQTLQNMICSPGQGWSMARFLLQHQIQTHTCCFLRGISSHSKQRAKRLAKKGNVWLLIPTWMEILQLVPLQEAKPKWHSCKPMGTQECAQLDFSLRFSCLRLQRRGPDKFPPSIPSGTVSLPKGNKKLCRQTHPRVLVPTWTRASVSLVLCASSSRV